MTQDTIHGGIVSDSKNFITASFLHLIPVSQQEAHAMIGAVAEILVVSTRQEETFAAKRSRLLPEVEVAAQEPSPNLADAVAINLRVERERASEIIRAACRAFLDQGDRDASHGLTKASSVAVEVLRASRWGREGAEETITGAPNDGPSLSDNLRESASFDRVHDDLFIERENGPDFDDRMARFGGPHGGGDGPD